MLQMTPEEQIARIRTRHEGTGKNSEDAVDYMKVAVIFLNLEHNVSFLGVHGVLGECRGRGAKDSGNQSNPRNDSFSHCCYDSGGQRTSLK